MNRASARKGMRTAAAMLLGVAVAIAPVITEAHSFGGGGGHSGGGGGHFSGGGHFGGGHAMSSPAAHFASAPRFSGGAHVAAYSGARFAAPHFAAAGAPRTFRAPAHGGFANVSAVHTVGARPGSGFVPLRGGYGRPWVGGFWRGVYWPRTYFYPGFAWFLPILPFGYATYWWGGVPYYYWNNLYYAYSPSDNGYVVTDPPPVADGGAPASGADGGAYAGGAGSADVYLYPRNGQSDQQMQNDRYECHSWAVSQTGFDPTRSAQQSGNAADYRRAMVACLDARGYSAR